MKALLIGGSKDLSQNISLILRVRWPESNLFHTAEATESTELIYREQPDIVMLHFPEPSEGPPALDYFGLISQIRSFSSVPIVVLSERDGVIDKARALELGADDWVTPSTVPMEFIARASAILRRCFSSNNHVSSLVNGKLGINYTTREVFVSGKQVKLTPIEYKILCHLARSEGSVVSHTELLHNIWGPKYGADKEILKMGVYRLRCKIEQDHTNPEIIFNERGVGYMIRPSHATEPTPCVIP